MGSEMCIRDSNTSVSTTDWALPVTLPPGNCRLQAVVFDAAGNNSGGFRREFSVTIPDNQAPAGTIISPATAGAILPSSTVMAGTATDAGGSGFDRVLIAIRNQTTAEWFDFSGGFSTIPSTRNANLSNTSVSSTDWALPVTLPPGNYRLQAVVFDTAGNNSGGFRRLFTVQ